ncbi:MAG: hypothetical protein IJU05_01025 [Schwartzia sp.]|nr:hypothetical protein [Schwartzia sp. (in: firmicutes)]
MKRCALLFAALFVFLLLSGVAVSEAATARLSVQITLYDLERDAGQPAAVGKAALTGMEQKARLFSVSPEPGKSGQAYERDVFYVTRTGRDMQTGATRFRVRHEQIVEGHCTAMEIREYTLQIGESCELYSDRGQIRAVMKFV